ncbi:MAG: PD-(D/E)XK nuclease family protein, partial [Bacteroidales bacterium]|nr:PD-(D/E)XK nuclease family protein [Bacteroidales bacterium]
KFKIQNSNRLSPETCHLKPETCNLKSDTCHLKPENYNHLITPEILQLFEEHLINLLRDIINPKLPFNQTDDVSHCRYCDYSAICKRHNTQDI